ncbi:MAG: hypothetical protein IJE52_07190 [Bacteroidales bacterium]|nr:hypothetical protein [Bacteroidales bacterium]
MKRMDSDIMGIIMALLTFLIPAISALLEKNRKKKKGEAVQDVQDSKEENEEESPFFDLKAIFDEVTEELAQEEESAVNEEYETAREPQVQPVLQVQEPEPVEYEELVEEAVPVTADVPVREVPGSVVPEGEKPKNKILQRLKENPADMVLFAEIMNPKYKEL